MVPALWHARSPDDALAALSTRLDGLTAREAADRLAAVGPNALPRGAPTAAWRVLLDQFRSVVVGLLVAACAIAMVTADRVDAAAIGAVLALNVAIGFTVEIRARRALESLSRLEARRATVIREGLPRDIDARDIVPGDVVTLEEGQSVPADARLLGGAELRVIESTLTGESVPVSKHAGAEIPPDAPLQDRRTMVYAGTSVAAGAGRAVVTATGVSTELGAIGRLVSETETEPTPLEQQLDRLGRQLVWVALGVGAATGALAWAQDAPAARVLQAALALAVAAVPEGLPAVATITLALGVHRMTRRQALVRRLSSVETLGSVTVLCTDKTGTLTAGAMVVTTLATASRTLDVTGTAYDPDGQFLERGVAIDPRQDSAVTAMLRAGVLANRADAVLTDAGWAARGDPTEAALVVAARKAGLERGDLLRALPEVGEVPFSSHRKMMATFHGGDDGLLTAFVKGAPQHVLERCTRIRLDGREMQLDDEGRASLLQTNDLMALRGLRVLALASGPVPRPEESALEGLTLAGLVGMSDPPAPGVREAIEAFRSAGIRTVMITGDQGGTARAVARDLALASEPRGLDGREIDAMTDAALSEALTGAVVFSRVSPEAKLRIVAAYQERGDIVAMIGDGVNDAAALKKADVGVTMGRRGSDVARETAAVVLLDDRFETIGAAIEEGRVVFDNIRKFVFYLFSCNLAEVVVLLGAGAAGFPLPLEPIQVLWLNLVTDTVPALALALEPAEADLMTRPPRDPRATLVSREALTAITAYALLIASSVFLVIAYCQAAGVPAGQAVTMNFMALALAQVFHLGNARDRKPVLHPWRALANPWALGAVALVLVVQALTVLVDPLATVLGIEALRPREWMVVVGASLLPAAIGQSYKAVRARLGARA